MSSLLPNGADHIPADIPLNIFDGVQPAKLENEATSLSFANQFAGCVTLECLARAVRRAG